MTKFLAGAMATAVVALFVFMLTRLSSDALGMAVGVVFGVLAGIPSALLVLASSRPPRAYEEDDDDDADLLARWRMERYGPNPQPFPYQPPVIVLAAPVEQKPQVVNNGSITVHSGASSVPTIAARQQEVAAQRGGRVFRVVGIGEDWDE